MANYLSSLKSALTTCRLGSGFSIGNTTDWATNSSSSFGRGCCPSLWGARGPRVFSSRCEEKARGKRLSFPPILKTGTVSFGTCFTRPRPTHLLKPSCSAPRIPQATNAWSRRSGARSVTGRGTKRSRSKAFCRKWLQPFIPTAALTSASLPLDTFKNQCSWSLFEMRYFWRSKPHKYRLFSLAFLDVDFMWPSIILSFATLNILRCYDG